MVAQLLLDIDMNTINGEHMVNIRMNDGEKSQTMNSGVSTLFEKHERMPLNMIEEKAQMLFHFFDIRFHSHLQPPCFNHNKTMLFFAHIFADLHIIPPAIPSTSLNIT